jgi:rod shape-determining protein MreB and related proteins
VEEAAGSAGARDVALVDEPLAAAIGAGLPIHEPIGNLVVDVGGGTSEMAVISMGGVVTGKALRIGGFEMDGAIQQHIRRAYGMAIGERTAEGIKMAIGSAYPTPAPGTVEVRGREIATGMPKKIEVAEEEIREALSEPVRLIVDSTRECLAISPPELAHDVLETGMFLTGGGSLLKGIDVRLARECEVPVHLTEQPLETVVLGAGRMLENLDEYKDSFLFTRQRR